MKYFLVLVGFAVFFSNTAIGQKQEAEILADTFWKMIQADSSSFSIYKLMGHENLDNVKLTETIIAAGVNFGKPSVIDRRGYLVSQASSGIMGKGQYVCFNYRNKYKDDLLGENLVFEKVVFFRKSKSGSLKLVQYSWSKKGTDISCD